MVQGKSLHDALFMLARISPSPKVAQLRDLVQRVAKDHPLRYLIPAVRLNEDGKVIGRRPSMRSSTPEEIEVAMYAEMFQHAAQDQQIHVFGVVLPALQEINLEHNIRTDDFIPVVSNNPFVPEGRELLYARGLYAGVTGDFLVAAHILIPQIEHSLRYVLQQHGVLTSSLDQEGIQDERNLNTTLYLPEATEIFGEDLIFDLKGLLVERFGSNLRNRMAHGLLDHAAFYTPQVAYLWWLTLRICCLPLIARMQEGEREADRVQESETADPNSTDWQNTNKR